MSFFVDSALLPASFALRTAGRDVLRGASLLGRGTATVVGAATLLVALALAGSEQMRERLLSTTLAVAGLSPEISTSSEAIPADAPMQSARGSDWLTVRPKISDPVQEQVTRYLSRRYKVAEDAVRQIVGEAFSTGRSLGIDPMLILAVTAVESSLNPFAQSAVGAQGLMQIMTSVHSDKFADHGGDRAALDPIANLKVGSEILRDLIRQGGSVERGLQLYVGAGNLPDDGGYASRVLAELARIRMAAARAVRAPSSAALGSERAIGAPPGATGASASAGAAAGVTAAGARRAT